MRELSEKEIKWPSKVSTSSFPQCGYQVCTCVLGTDEGHLISVRFEADESTFPVHGLPGIRMEGVEPEGKSEHKS